MRSRRWLWLGAAALLFAGAAWLMSRGDVEDKPPEEVQFPRHLRGEEVQRMQRRKTLLPLLAQAPLSPGQPVPTPRKRPLDPVLAALPGKGAGKSAVVLEANALRNSPVGELLLDCLRAGKHNPIEQMKQNTGIDVLKDLDRMAVTTDGVLVSGNFQNAQWDKMMHGAVAQNAYGDKGTVYEFPEREGRHGDPRAIGRWNDQMIIVGDSPADVQRVIDRLEGRAPDEEPLISEQDTYGEMYGVLAAEDLAGMLPPEEKEIATRLKDAAEHVKLHVDAMHDVAMVADVDGPDGQKVADLGKSLGAGLALGRLKAQADGQKDLAELLDLAQVAPKGEDQDGRAPTFRAELAVPMSVLEKRLAWCRDHAPADGGAVLHSGSPGPGAAAEEDEER